MDNFKTRVLCVDMPQDVINYLTKEQLEVYDYKVEPSLDARNLGYSWDRLPIAMPFNIPENLHEYSVIIQDLSSNSKIIPYDLSKHNQKKTISDANAMYKCLCLRNPQNVFDPLPFTCRLIENGLKAKKGKIIKVFFQSAKYSKVHSLYIVNNERGKEPLKRQMPPFTDHQIKDAEYSYRAMAYTYQLFNLYFEIQNGVVTKGEARNALLVPGIVNFRSNFKVLGKPYKYITNTNVVCVEIHGTNISVGDSIYFEDANKRFYSTKILCIQVDHKNFDSIREGKVGIELETKVPRNAVLYIKK